MTKRLLSGFAFTLVFFFAIQNVCAQATVEGEVTSLHPEDGALLCIHEYEKAVAIGTITNNHTDRAIRGRITIQVLKRISNTQWDSVDVKKEVKLIDVSSSAPFTVDCAPDLAQGTYTAKVWLQWQYVSEDPETGSWFTLKSPMPPFTDTEGGPVIDHNTHHLFVITPCTPELPGGLQGNN